MIFGRLWYVPPEMNNAALRSLVDSYPNGPLPIEQFVQQLAELRGVETIATDPQGKELFRAHPNRPGSINAAGKK